MNLPTVNYKLLMEKVLKKSRKIQKRILPIGDTWKVYVRNYPSKDKKCKEQKLILIPQIKIEYQKKTRKNIHIAIKQSRNILETITKISIQQMQLQTEASELIKTLTTQLNEIRKDICKQSDQVDGRSVNFQIVLEKIQKFTIAANKLIQKFVEIIKNLRKPKVSLDIITSLELIAEALQNIAQLTKEITKQETPPH